MQSLLRFNHRSVISIDLRASGASASRTLGCRVLTESPPTRWTSGGRLDLVRIGEACRKLGAALVLDLPQSLGALPFSVRDARPDFAVAASYKWLLGPYSVGLLYVAPRWQGGTPLEENWIQRANAS